ncbi:MAG TPA: SDR family oxidoreductase [Alphaproteobacteria bacterium]|nr:SDR family oxidoreductase [Alphaproteobacteria bacterium]
MSGTERMERDLCGRAAIVTGASRNIGRAIARALAERGAAVLVHARGSRDEAEATAAVVRKAGGEAAVVLADLAQPEAPGMLVEAALERFGRIDIVVNNAAIRPEAPFGDIAYDDWRKVMALCLDSAFLLSQAALPALKASDQAAVVNLGGLTGHTGAKNRAHVIAAKAGITGLTKAMAHDLADHGITVNCVSPGLIETERAGGSRPHHHAARTNVLGRRGTSEDVAAAVVMLCGSEARYITGQTIHVNGGALMV